MPLPATLLLLAALGASADPAPVTFSRAVAPILVRKCAGCHNDQKAQAGLNMKTAALIRKGGKGQGSQILVPGDPDASGLIDVIKPDAEPRMPLKQPPLSADEIATLERWVKEGAKFDVASESDTPIASLIDPLRGLARVPVRGAATDPITAVAVHPSGSPVALARGASILLFDRKSGEPAGSLDGHPGSITAIALDPAGVTLVAAGGRPGQFGALTVWDVASKSRRYDLRGHADSILGMALAPDGKTAATAGYDRAVVLWDIATGAVIRTLREHTDSVYGVAFSSDGTRLATCGADRTVKVWDVATGKKLVTMSESTGELYAVRFSPDGRHVLAGGVDRTIRRWELHESTATLVGSAIAHDAPILGLRLVPNATALVSYGEDRAIKLWDQATLAPLRAFERQPDWPLSVAPDPTGSTLLVGRYDGSAGLLDTATGALALALLPRPASPAAPQPAPRPRS